MDRSQLEALSLNPDTIATHQRRVRRALSANKAPQFRIKDTCRLDNQGLLRLSQFQNLDGIENVVAFVPAAGAATRYAAALQPLLEALTTGDERVVADTARRIDLQGPLPESLRSLLADPESFPPSRYAEAVADLEKPKALQPCVTGAPLTFLEVKDLEHRGIRELKGQMFVAPFGQTPAFRTELKNSPMATEVIEQGPELSTLRFDASGEAVTEEDGSPSFVPAGHGALTEKLPVVARSFPQADAVFIRNIDNVMGTHPEALGATKQFLQVYSLVHRHLQVIRKSLRDNHLDAANRIARDLLRDAGVASDGSSPLVQVMKDLFHTTVGDISADLIKAYERPFNVLGQVPNIANDVGGTPCFVEHGDDVVKLCLEVPHASEQDKADFLANPEKATHFNPVFACAEITQDPNYYADLADDFWLLAEKQHRGQTVYYHESVLYELIGNSLMANCMFIEVPRKVFHPHKTIADGAGKTMRSWFPQA